MISQRRSVRKPSGGKYKDGRKKKKYERADNPTLTKVDENTKIKTIRVRGGNQKSKVLRVSHANVIKDGKPTVTKIKKVIENPANRNYVRRNILNKGTIIETELGKAKVTSRPGQDGTVNAVIIK